MAQERKVFNMAFLGELVRYLVSYILLIAIAVGGVFFGGFLRKRKNQKAAEEK